MNIYGQHKTRMWVKWQEGHSNAALVSLFRRYKHVRSVVVDGCQRFTGLTEAVNQCLGKGWTKLELMNENCHDPNELPVEHLDDLAEGIKRGCLSAIEEINFDHIDRHLTSVFDAITPTSTPRLKLLSACNPRYGGVHDGEEESLVRLCERMLGSEDHAAFLLKVEMDFWM